MKKNMSYLISVIICNSELEFDAQDNSLDNISNFRVYCKKQDSLHLAIYCSVKVFPYLHISCFMRKKTFQNYKDDVLSSNMTEDRLINLTSG